MSDTASRGRVRTAFFVTASIAALALPGIASAQSGPAMAEEAPQIVTNDALDTNGGGSGGALDTGINGVGQMIVFAQSSPTAAGLGLCSGTLVNPRTVIFAAHCVNSRAAHLYGSQTGTGGGVNGNFGGITSIGTTGVTRAALLTQGVPMSWGFQATNRCLATTPGVNAGTATVANPGNGCQAETGAYEKWRNSNFSTVASDAIYNVNQVWYDTRSLEPNSRGFLYADIALATLDTHADNIPTWIMLFSPLAGETHGTITGYGTSNSQAGAQGTAPCTTNCNAIGVIDYRRRVAENMISALVSLDQRNDFLFGGVNTTNPQTLYQTDFDSPTGPQVVLTPEGDPTVAFPNYDFDLFDGAALPREAVTAPGDSGGPLIADRAFSKAVVAGVLSGGTRFFGGQRFSTYGTNSFYQPLFLYWEEIVANNPYVYAFAKTGSRNWFDPTHWVQDMDPNYTTSSDGQLVNTTPNFRADGNGGNGPRFGTVCFLDECADLSDLSTPLPGAGTPVMVAGGPGSQNFVPNNIAPVNSATAAANVKARYYEVTLRKAGTTTLDQAATIDRFNLSERAELAITNSGNLTVLGDYTQSGGALTLNGRIKTGEALIAGGQLAGSGTFDPTFLTVMRASILPGGFGTFGQIGVQGDLILTSATFLQVDVNNVRADRISVFGDMQNPGIASLGGTLFINRPAGFGPRAGQSFEILSASGGVQGRFDTVFGVVGVLTATASYGANNVVITFGAGSLSGIVGTSPKAAAFAGALDQLRGSSYNDLYGLYGAIDVMESAQLTETLANLAPQVAGLAQIEAGRQKNMVLGMVTDRLSMLGTSRATSGQLAVIGAPETLGLAIGQTQVSGSTASQLSFARSLTSNRTMGNLPETMSGFISGGYEAGRPGEAGIATGGTRSTWHIAMGLEMEAAADLTLGTAFGYVNGRSNVTGSESETRTSQAIAYGSYRLSKKAYIAGLASVTNTDIGVQRGVTDGLGQFNLNGDTHAMSYDLQLETGMNFGLAEGLTLTPRAALRYSSTVIDGYRERGAEVALLVDEIAEKRLEARMGAQIAGATKVMGWTLTPHLAADRVQALSTAGSALNVRFADAAAVAIRLPGFSTDRSWTEVKGGLSFAKGPLSFGAALQSSIGRDDYRDDRAVADFTFRF